MDKGRVWVKERGSKKAYTSEKCEEHVHIKISTKRKSSNQFITNLF